MQNAFVPLPQKTVYQYQSVTYEVTSHFSMQEKPLKEKLCSLLLSEVKTQPYIHTFDNSQNNGVE